jgi:uncharacterized protein with PQ loop repeat
MRLKDAGLSPFFAILLAIPPVNFLLLGILTAIPSHESEESDTALVRDNSILSRLIPESSLGVAVCAATVSSGIAVLGVLLGAYGLGNFGSPLFLGLPFYGGFISAVIYGAEKRRTVKECLGVAFLSLIITATALVCFLIEGIICIAVLLPLAGVFSLIGALFGYSVQFIRQKRSGRIESSLLCGVIVTLSLAIPVPDSPVLKTVSHITIDRPPRDVWPHIIAFSEIEKPKEWLFLRGVAYPIRARIEGYGVGAVRYCEFSTGPFVEPITVWNEPHELRFTVTQTPPALTEYNPLGTVISPHLDGYFESLGGQFLLTEPSHGVTEIQATTWYRHRVSPVWYWQMISNPILHMIHGRVLEHIKMKAEVRM